MNDSYEKEVIIKIQNGHINYFEKLVKKYSRIIFSYIRQKVENTMDAEDITQNAFIKAYKAINRFDSNRSFYPLLFAITKNEIAEFYRKRKETLRLKEDWATPENLPDSIEIDIYIKHLKPKYQKVLKLLVEGYSYQEISQKLHKPINTIKTLIHRARIDSKKYEEKVTK